ncbi:4-diphosphocytidyl-2-C-methyl-D-erythritol kinase [Paraconexibacter sp. AEG42_29]|uniref:4-diphosphocytidyl-2-C-methyl-D-erythritol kinase n=1 Tax=Paraconexibacter sp. AEG42_29 TaxID=2997339 RepID=A0AAU7B0T9_9ACTN
MSSVHTRAPGKINVCLFVGATRPSDGRHELVSVMQAVDLCDEVWVEDADADALVCPRVSGENIVTAALARFRARSGRSEPVAITIAKAIPVAAGMAGGSADAGAVLRLLDEHCGTGLGDDVLRELAAGLGADVPAQVRPGRYLALGAGERVAARRQPRPYGVVVLPHPEPLSTPAVYREFDRLRLARPATELAALAARVQVTADDLPDALVVNDLEPAAISLCPPVGRNLERLRSAGADLVLVSGSGPTTLGLTRDLDAAVDVAARLGPEAIATRVWDPDRSS